MDVPSASATPTALSTTLGHQGDGVDRTEGLLKAEVGVSAQVQASTWGSKEEMGEGRLRRESHRLNRQADLPRLIVPEQEPQQSRGAVRGDAQGQEPASSTSPHNSLEQRAWLFRLRVMEQDTLADLSCLILVPCLVTLLTVLGDHEPVSETSRLFLVTSLFSLDLSVP